MQERENLGTMRLSSHLLDCREYGINMADICHDCLGERRRR